VLQPRMEDLSPDTPRAKTDENGRFRITKVAAGAYFVRTIAPGFTSTSETAFEPQGKTLNLADGEAVENMDLELKRGGVITGRVVDTKGRPLVEEGVELFKVDKDGKREYFQLDNFYQINSTDDRGVYRIYGLPEGRYLVHVGISGGEGPIAMQSNSTY